MAITSVVVGVTATIIVLGYVGALGVAITGLRKNRRAALLLIAGLAIWCVSYIASMVLNVVWASTLPPSQMGTYAITLNCLRAVLHVLGLGCVVAAVFTGRPVASKSSDESFLPSDQVQAVADSNPFASPT